MDETIKIECTSPKDKNNVDFALVKQQIMNLKQQFTILTQTVSQLEKNVAKQNKQNMKKITKNKNKGNRKPSGFAKPMPVTEELCSFMNKEKGTELPRTEVTQYLIKYIKQNKLEDVENKKKIMPDNSLKKLLGVTDSDEVTYFSLQSMMNKHFVSSKVETL